MSILNEIAAGGQTWAHRVRMLRQVLKIIIALSFSVSLLIFVYRLAQHTPKQCYYALWYRGEALLYRFFDKSIEVDPHVWQAISKQPSRGLVSTKEIFRHTAAPVAQFVKILKESLSISGWIFLALSILLTVFFFLRGKGSKKKEHLSGIKMLSDVELNLKLILSRQASDIRLGNIPMLKNSEAQHMLICGTTGTGKTNCLMSLLKQIRRRGDRAIILDTTSSFVSNFYKEKEDILINPYDRRSVYWHPWCECQKDYHYEQLVNSLIPSMQYFDNFFPEAGRAVLYSALRKAAAFGNTDIEEFVSSMLRKSVGELYEDLKDTDAAVYVDPKGDKTTVSVRATISNSMRHFRPLKKTDTPFSIRDWILSQVLQKQWLFISCTTEQRRSINSLMSVWFSVAINAMKARPLNKNTEKVWFIIDELQSLQKLEYLEESLAELRKYGGCIVIATQDVSQMDKLYGQHSTKSIINLCGTKVCFRQEDAEIAQRMAKFFGEKEFKEVQEGLSYGAHEMRDGVNLSKHEKIKSTVSPTKILSLNNLEAYIKLPGSSPTAKTKFKYEKTLPITEGFLAFQKKEKNFPNELKLQNKETKDG